MNKRKKIALDPRLSAIAGFVRLNCPVADIGTDHALLPCFLSGKGHRIVYATDIKKNPLKQGKKTMEAYGISDVTLLLSDGFEKIPHYPDMDFIIAGMGGERIAEILANHQNPSPDQRFILQPMTRHSALRRGLYSLGYEILSEKAVVMEQRHYTIIYAAYNGIKKEISDIFAYTGMQNDKEYLSSELSKLRKMANKDNSFLNLIKEIENIYDCS